jgi:phosphatidylglycerophosphate synthase
MSSDTAARTAAFRNPVRQLTSLLTPLETRVLRWLAERMPASVNSDHLTVLALVAMAGAGAAFWLTRVTPVGYVLVVVCLAINWFGDSLDGTLARVRKQERPRYGYYVDHVVDALGIACLAAGFALSGVMTPLIAAGFAAAYFMLASEIYLASHSLGTFRMSFYKMGPTELRIVLAAGAVTLAIKGTGPVLGLGLSLFDLGGLVAIAGLLVTFVASAAANTRTLARAEPRPARAAESGLRAAS